MDEAARLEFAYEQAYRVRRQAGHAGLYDDYRSDIAHFARALRAPYVVQRGNLLVLGCGAGNLALWFAKRGFTVAGMDISSTAIAWAKARAKDEQIPVDFLVGTATDLSAYPNNQFDMVLDEYCLHFLLGPDRTQCLTEVHRVLRPGGLFLIESICRTDSAKTSTPTIEYVEVAGIPVPRYVASVSAIVGELIHHGFHIQWSEIAPYKDDQSYGDLSLHVIKESEHVQ